MTNEKETASELRSSSVRSGPDHPRKPYSSPRLREWGSITELTGGVQAGFTDAGFNGGSGAV
jgi:hypothetical protein